MVVVSDKFDNSSDRAVHPGTGPALGTDMRLAAHAADDHWHCTVQCFVTVCDGTDATAEGGTAVSRTSAVAPKSQVGSS